MNGLDKITGRIAADAQAKADQILAQAREEAEAITANFQTRAAKLERDMLVEGQTQADQRAQRVAGAARLEGKKRLLEAKQEVLEETFQTALHRLRTLPREEYTDLLARLMVRASATGAEQVILNPADRQSVGPAALEKANGLLKGGRLTLSDATRDMAGGCVLADGPVEVNCALEALVDQEKGRLSADVARVLFAE